MKPFTATVIAILILFVTYLGFEHYGRHLAAKVSPTTIFRIDGVRPSDNITMVVQKWGPPETLLGEDRIWLGPSFKRIIPEGKLVAEVVGKNLTFGRKTFTSEEYLQSIKWELRPYKMSGSDSFKDSTGNILTLTQRQVNSSGPLPRVSGFVLQSPSKFRK